MRIQVDPERLAELSGRCLEVASGLADVEYRCRSALDSLDWEVRQRAGVEKRVWTAVVDARFLSDRAEAMARFLRDAAERFAEADRQELHLVEWIMGRRPLPLPPFLHVSVIDTGRIMDFLPPHLPVPRVVPLAGGGVVLGGLTIGGLAPVLPDFLERVWNWLHGYGWKTNQELLPLPEAKVPKGKLAETVERAFERIRTSPPPGQAAPQPAGSSAGQEAVNKPDASGGEVPFGHPVPRISQQGLKYGGQTTQYGCTAASTAMVLEYWHSRDPRVGRLSAQEILDINARQGTFDGHGMSVSAVHDEVKNLGYSVVEDHINADFEALKRDVEKGPVIAIVKLGMKRTGYNHAVVVTGISDDGRVVVNDPWDGQTHIYSVEEFLASWGADFGGMKNMYTVIRP